MEWQAEPTFLIAADCGGTKCRVRIYGYMGNIIGEGVAGPANMSLGPERTLEEILKASKLAISQCGLPIAFESTILSAGIAGLVDDEAAARLKSLPHPFKEFHAASDAYTAYLGAFGGDQTNAAIAIFGTGSSVFGKDENGYFTLGGWGLPLSDQASGARLGQLAVRESLKAAEGIQPASPLTDQIIKRLGGDAKSIYRWSLEAKPADYAIFCPDILNAADLGDDIASFLVKTTRREAQNLLAATAARGVKNIVLMGGLSEFYKNNLHEKYQPLITTGKGDAIEGARLMANEKLATVTLNAAH